MSQLTLYGFLLCPYVQRVRFALENIGVKYDYKEVDLYKFKHKEQAYLDINPFGKVPSISFNNQIIYESLPLLEFLENEFGGVFPQDNIRKTQQRIWANYFDQNFIDKMWAILGIIKKKDAEGSKKLANELAEAVRFFTKNSKLSERIKLNPNNYFEGDTLTYVDFAVVPHFKMLDAMYRAFFKVNFFDQIENQDELIQNFKTYYQNVISSDSFKRTVTNPLNLPAQGDNFLLDQLQYTPESYHFDNFIEIYITKKFVEA
ncbi:glutathione S-transferase, amine-terminal domain protein (macronuclear) [Tetrahymena thermophila SB210]|uniref:Glutathione S-transferase, amine-terminal domain protein n=1 Tax=Tetrahymena thermophila (strain SB210) TaxID=312017 RepID=Q24HX4_TETTS|nr:glutathione S-transferase, amine-terminal domain protein [Tetrahymena thermophila SB210]EAS07464.1 glutathione S-transferase, amine-terminal domain protein [Tetrahymena thermophila SB210]|eukprot:XP_001027706.1 glutathione S-transferase, amine-terminal domain protein [Tetrahymena thermophila SB210]